MDHHPIEELLPRAGGSVYRLVRMVANRALELADGKPALIPKHPMDKVTTIAIKEVAMGKLVYVNGEGKDKASRKQETKEDKEDKEDPES